MPTDILVPPTEAPTAVLTLEPTALPTEEPSATPTPTPTPSPTPTPEPKLTYTLADAPDSPSSIASGGSIEYVCTDQVTLVGNDVVPAANPSATVSASFALTIDDTRTDPNWSGYAVGLGTGSFTSEGSDSVIGPDLLTVVDVAGLPDEASPAIGQALDSPAIVLTVADGSPAISTTVTVTIAMILPTGTRPGTYTGSISFDVLPLSGP